MAAQTANSQLSFKLPSMSYIDATWEEPSLRVAPASTRRASWTVSGWLKARFASFTAWRLEQRTLTELSGMSDRDLLDVGLSRSDISRVFDHANNGDLRSRGLRD